MATIFALTSATRIEDETTDRFVEILDRSSRGQHVVIDPLLHEKRFQEKWKRPNGAGTTSSSQELVSEQNPQTKKFYPPMFISRVRTGVPLSPSSPLAQCRSVPVIKFKSETVSFFDQGFASLLDWVRGSRRYLTFNNEALAEKPESAARQRHPEKKPVESDAETTYRSHASHLRQVQSQRISSRQRTEQTKAARCRTDLPRHFDVSVKS